MYEPPSYQVNLYLNGELVGDIRRLAQGLKWVRRRTRVGVDEIDFTLNDVLFSDWCEQRGTTLSAMLKPLALECRVVRGGVEVCGGFLATLPSYQPNEVSANLAMKFDGFLNLLDGVYLAPSATQHGHMQILIENWIDEANSRSEAAGKGYGFVAGTLSNLPIVDQTFENYTSVKQVITNRCDNTTGAGPFDVFFHPDKTYDILADSEYGRTVDDYNIQYPAPLSGVSAIKISAQEVNGFASVVIGIGSGEVGEEGSTEEPAPTSIKTNSEAVQEFGYFEIINQDSSVSRQETLDRNTQAALDAASNAVWQPQVELTGRQVSPIPTGAEKTIWVGDRVTVRNLEDLTGMTTGRFRVNELAVSVSASNAEVITPTLARGNVNADLTLAQEFVKIQRELLALKTARTATN